MQLQQFGSRNWGFHLLAVSFLLPFYFKALMLALAASFLSCCKNICNRSSSSPSYKNPNLP